MIDAFNGSFKYLATIFTRVGQEYEKDVKLGWSIFSKGPIAMPLEVLEKINKIYDNYKTQYFKCDLIVLYNKDINNIEVGGVDHLNNSFQTERKVFKNLKKKYKLVYNNTSYLVFKLYYY